MSEHVDVPHSLPVCCFLHEQLPVCLLDHVLKAGQDSVQYVFLYRCNCPSGEWQEAKG